MTDRSLRPILLTLALAAAASFGVAPPLAAADLASSACGPTAAAATGEAPLFASGLPDAGEQSVCYASCANGSTISCSGTSCSAQDSQCSTGGPNGSCWGSSTGNRTCGPCPSTGCSATATCPSGGSVSCTGANYDCFAVDGCYAYCDGQYTWCPNLKYECPL